MQFSNFQNYITGINRSGSTKSHMIDKIAGCFTNNVTKYWCTAILAKYLDKDAVTLSTESKLRDLLNRSSDQVVLEIFKMVELENKHVGQYREDSLKDHPMTVPGHTYVMSFEKYTLADIFPDDLLGQAVDNVTGKLDDLEAFLRDVISQDPKTEYAFEAMSVLENIRFSINEDVDKAKMLVLLKSNSAINTKNPMKNEYVEDWSKTFRGNIYMLISSYSLKKPIIVSGGFNAKEGDVVELFDDGNKTTKFRKTHEYRGSGTNRYLSKNRGDFGKVLAVAENAEEITKNFENGTYQLYVIK
jgi:hypothetical protein